ncbi:MAG: response regulator [Chloroflexota bacterium]
MTEKPVDILLVEDNPSDVELSLYALRKNRIVNQVQVARDGVDALDFLFCTGQFTDRHIENAPRVIFLDLKLPRVDGMEVLRRVKSDERTRSIPVVVLTSSREERDLSRCYRLGVNSYVVKPIDFEKFTEVVTRLGFYWLSLNELPADKVLGGEE